MKFEIIPTKRVLYDKCENVEQLYDNFYFPLLVEFKELQQENQQLKEQLKATNKGLRKAINKRKKWKARYYKQKYILDKLEKWLEEERNSPIRMVSSTELFCRICLNELKELKGSDSNE